MKNNRISFLGIIVLTTIIMNCTSSDDGSEDRGNWVRRSVFDGIPRSNASSFTINNMGYMGTGYDGDDYLTDFWQYDINGDFWVQKADFPGMNRSSASGFEIDNKGYIGIGYDGDNELSDFWQYDPETNSWIQKADFGGSVRRAAVGFGINGKGYIGTGYDGDNDRKDFWKYDPQTDEWEELVGFGGDKRRDAVTFKINDKIYLGTGVSNGLFKQDFWEFDPSTEVWTRKLDLDSEDDYFIVRSNAVGFSIDGLGYIATGFNTGALSTIWEYDPLTDLWEEITRLEANIRQDAVSFTDGIRAYVLLGRSGNLYLDDNYELFPQEEFDEDD